MLTHALAAPYASHVAQSVPDFAALRAREFARLDADGHAYLDHVGSALHPDSLVTAHMAMLRGSVLGNPHAESPASLASSALIAEARGHLLQYLDADPEEYEVVFTANATAAIALVAESFAFGPAAPLVLTADNHNSVNGIRERAARAGSAVHVLPLDDELRLDDPMPRLVWIRRPRVPSGLLAFPAQSNFSGVRHPLTLVRDAQARGWQVLLDAAAFLPTARLRLREVPADFVVLSFYKMFGYPTGVGALVARRESLDRLRRPSFSGGTVDYASVQHGTHKLREGAEGFEDGTANFLAIGAVTSGLSFLEATGVEHVARHAASLTELLVARLRALRHPNGQPAVQLYGPRSLRDRGATVVFNVLTSAGDAVPFTVVEQAARADRVSVRGGCFCNPGASEAAFGFLREVTARCLASTSAQGWSIERFAECMRGYAVGAVRASFGMASNEADAERLVRVVESLTT